MNFGARLRRLRRTMSEEGVPALLVTHLPDIRYMCGFTGSNAVLALTATRAVLFTDGRYKTQAREEVKGVRVVIAAKSALLEAMALLAAAEIERVEFDGEHLSVAQLKTLQGVLPKSRRRSFLVAAERQWVAELRMVKDADEQRLMKQAAALGSRLFEEVLPFLEPGVAETEIAARLEHGARTAGAEAMSFPTIVAGGERSALPHGTASSAKLPRHGFVILDFGVILDGYCSDMTRTVHIGRSTPEERRAYEAVQEAQEAGLSATRAGVSCGEVDRACREVLARHKLAKYFTHSTGHGVGLEIHEAPRVGKDQGTLLAEGCVITIEPGIYLGGRFGIRIEDSVVVREQGAEVLTEAPKAWIEL